MAPETTKGLRDHILAALSKHPGTRTFHVHVLITAPRKSNALFPFATPRPPRVYLQDILVILSEQAIKPMDAPRRIVSAIEASVYNIPNTSSAVLYVSKVDSTGQASAPSPTALLVRSVLGYYANPKTRPVEAKHLWIQLFARAQAQYLFSASKEWEGKKPLNDTKLCAWWKRVLTRVALDLEKEESGKAGKEAEGKAKEENKDAIGRKMYYLLPGYSELEAENALRIAGSESAALAGTDGVKWEYGHPYSQTEIPLPCPVDGDETKKKNLGRFIPYFDDCPKSRFLDEIAYTTDGEIRSPQKKRARRMTNEEKREEEKDKEKGKEKEKEGLGEMGKVTAEEFWERMSFRQECVAGAVTGFFTLIVSGRVEESGVSPLAPQDGQVPTQVNKRIMTTLLTGVEFSTVERAVKATETVEGAIKGLCEGRTAAASGASAAATAMARALLGVGDGRKTPEREVGPVEEPRTPERRRVVAEPSPNPFAEPETSLETYHGAIYGRVCTSNAVVGSAPVGEGSVTVLAVRRKKRAV